MILFKLFQKIEEEVIILNASIRLAVSFYQGQIKISQEDCRPKSFIAIVEKILY
jgi:hypothetical protein